MTAETHDDSNERVLELLVIHLSVHVDTRQPAPVSWMRVVPSNSALESSCLFTVLDVFHHVLVRLGGSIDTGLGPLDGECKGIHDDYRVSYNLSLHETHDFVWDARSRVNDLCGGSVRVAAPR